MNTETRFRLYRTFFNIVGNPIMGDGKSVASRMYAVFAMSIGYGCWIGQVIETFKRLDNTEEMLECARIAMPLTTSYWIDMFVRFRKSSIDKLIRQTEQFVWEDCPRRNEDSGNLTMAGLIPWVQKAMVHITWIVLGPHSVYMLFRGVGSEKLGLPMWTPFDSRRSPIHEIIIIIQIYSTLVNLSLYVAFLGLYATLVCIACSQLEKLQARLKDFRKENQLDPVADKEKLHECVRLHQNVLRYYARTFLEELRRATETLSQKSWILPTFEKDNYRNLMRTMEDTLSAAVLGHFLIVIGALCFLSMAAVTIWGQIADVMQVIMVAGLFIMQLGIYCFFGEELIHQATLVKESVWQCRWVGAPFRQQRTLMFMMTAANQDLALTAGGFAPLSHHTMMTVLNQVLSYAMFLINVREDTGPM